MVCDVVVPEVCNTILIVLTGRSVSKERRNSATGHSSEGLVLSWNQRRASQALLINGNRVLLLIVFRGFRSRMRTDWALIQTSLIVANDVECLALKTGIWG